MSDDAPRWLLEMRAITGLSEKPGSGDEPKIMAMRDYIAKKYTDMSAYCAGYTHDAIPWCGLAEAYCMARADIRPPFKSGSDTDCFLWARAWADDPNFLKLATPRLGCIVVLTRSGGGHVTTYESDAGSSIRCRGGNQSDAVNVASYPKSNVIAYVWPKEGGEPPKPPEPEPEQLPILRKGSKGPSVAYMQSLIPKWIDGDFGTTTEALLKEFQRVKGLEIDGICGEQTWTALGAVAPTPAPEPEPTPEPGDWIENITATVFGGAADNENSAYSPYDTITADETCVALPYRFKGTRPMVEVMNAAGQIVRGQIRDVGPWMINDPYWETDTRPIAETCYKNKTPLPSGPQKGKVPSNDAGIDLSLALAKKLGIKGKGKVAWRLI
jgi:uncharacterized protein (TIGR02594 family)